MTTHSNSDIHEALRRKSANTPKLPSDFMQRVRLADEKQKTAETRRRWMRISTAFLSAAAILVMALILMKPDAEVVVTPSEHVTAHVHHRSTGGKDVATDTEAHEAVKASTQPAVPLRQKKSRSRHEVVEQAEVAVIEQVATDELLAETTLDESREVMDAVAPEAPPTVDLDFSPEREAQLMAQLEQIEPEVYAYLSEVSAQAKLYKLLIDKELQDANGRAREMEPQPFMAI